MVFTRNKLRIVVLLVTSQILAACSGFNQTAIPTSTLVLPTPTETATINWFPATNTPTPLPLQAATPTPGVVPGVGSLLFRDNFRNANLWTATTSIAGNSIVSNNQLTLTLSEGTDMQTITSLRMQPQVSDFYAEINTQLSLCRGKDQVSLLFRVTSAADFYRYSVSCSGEVRLERVVSGKPFVIRDWTPSPDAPFGAPGEIKMSVWAFGRDLRFFLDDQFQFNINDQFFSQGGLGVSIRSDSGNPMSVSFSKLIIHAVP
ncbi:MAG: hypothetical protein ABIJ65_11420 [Chloroflexota bacterium]